MKNLLRLIFIMLIFLGFILLNGCNDKNESEWGYRKLLPVSATEIKELYWTDDFLPDYEYYLKAKMNRNDFRKYSDTLGLKLHTDTSKYTDDIENLYISGLYTDSINWWNTNTPNDSLFVWQRGDEWNIVRYFNGYLYLYAHEH